MKIKNIFKYLTKNLRIQNIENIPTSCYNKCNTVDKNVNGGDYMYNAIDIATYIVNYSAEAGESITNLKLQKILYYLQAAFLVKFGKRCFKEDIVGWRHGPVVTEVYNKFSVYGASDIPEQKIIGRLTNDNGKIARKIFPFEFEFQSEKEHKIFKKVVDGLLGYSPWFLVERTHEENPWDDLPELNLEICDADIMKYFTKDENRGRMYGDFNQ